MMYKKTEISIDIMLEKRQKLHMPITTKLSEEEYENVLTLARKQGISQTSLIREGIRLYLYKYENLLTEAVGVCGY